MTLTGPHHHASRDPFAPAIASPSIDTAAVLCATAVATVASQEAVNRNFERPNFDGAEIEMEKTTHVDLTAEGDISMLSVEPSVDGICSVDSLNIASPSRPRARPHVPLECRSKTMACELAAEGRSATLLRPHQRRQQRRRRKKCGGRMHAHPGAAGWQSGSVFTGDIAMAESGESNSAGKLTSSDSAWPSVDGSESN
ncbi:hypothetical protein BGW80DRAFT_653830 [Lactifluus volemus]|nr:hypothetical protein BGW80DRAFT_653830 [Lactifluus volemus]